MKAYCFVLGTAKKRIGRLARWIVSAPLARPLAGLATASLVACVLFGIRASLARSGLHSYLIWNLALAWLPLFFALILSHQDERRARLITLIPAGLAWLLFFPNAPYICTDLVHLSPSWQRTFWPDLVLILLFALLGLIVGFLSLYLIQRIVARRCGPITGWSFAAVMTTLCGPAIYLGRFHRWNSWDVLLNPFDLLTDVARCLLHPKSVIVPALFATFVSLAYMMLYSLTQVAALPDRRKLS
jgi:uncharacterized membrane protein